MTENKAKKPNIIMLVIDGARVDRIKKSREFTDCTKLGTTFTNMFTYAPYTLASMGAIFSGTYGSLSFILTLPQGSNSLSKLFLNFASVKV